MMIFSWVFFVTGKSIFENFVSKIKIDWSITSLYFGMRYNFVFATYTIAISPMYVLVHNYVLIARNRLLLLGCSLGRDASIYLTFDGKLIER